MKVHDLIKKTVAVEGGYVNDPVDAGGETKYGISKRSYPSVDIAALTLDEAIKIYERDYWNRMKLGTFHSQRIAWKVFDIEVNTGRGDELLQKALGLVSDGIVGSKTIEAANKADVERLMDKLIELQVKRYVEIVVKSPAKLKFLVGWINRAFERGEEIK
jgi:lysozyme family protein